QQVKEASGISGGVCSVLGCGEATLILDAARDERFFVHAIDDRDEAVHAVGQALSEPGLYGHQAVVDKGTLERLPYADNMIDLMVVGDLAPASLGRVALDEIARVLRPRGKAVLAGATVANAEEQGSRKKIFDAWIDGAAAAGLVVEQTAPGDVSLVTFVKPVPKGIDAWSHWQHGPDNNPVSTDQQIRAPYRTQWLGLPLYIAMPAITTSAGGRMYIAMGHIAHHRREEPWLNTLLARNAYNGSILWQRKLPDGYLAHRSAFIATDDSFLMIGEDGRSCAVLDPDTGDEKDRIRIPDLPGGHWKWMALDNGVLYVLTGPKHDPSETTIVRSEQTHWSWGELSRGYYAKRVPWGFGQTIVAYDMKTRRSLWSRHEKEPIDSRAMVLGDGRVFYYGPDSHVACLDASSGDLIWSNNDEYVRGLIEEEGRGLGSTPGFRSSNYTLYTPEALVFEAQTRMNVVAVAPKTGKLLWQKRKTTNNPNPIYVDGRVLVGVGPGGQTLVLDPVSGETVEELDFKKRACARLTATPDSFFCRGWPEGLTRYDRTNGKVLFNGAFRPSCNDGVIAANGLLYLGPWACDCNLSVMGRVALCSATPLPSGDAPSAAARLQTGAIEAAGEGGIEVTAADWSTYRGNVSRTAASPVSVSSVLTRLWNFKAGELYRPTAPTTAAGMVYLAGDDGKVRAIDATDGSERWTFLTAGPILHPPTIAGGHLFVGSGDGHVYSLDAATGRLRWRFRVAPVDRRMMVYGKLCSTWPVNSGVLVHDGVAYAAAGIIDYDGTYVCALDAETGALRWMNDRTGHLDPQLRKGVSAQGVLTIAGDRLWLAGGNVLSPVAFDLQSGEYRSGMPGDGSPQADRGEEVAVFQGRYVVQGGRLRYSAVRNVVNPGTFAAFRVEPGKKKGPRVHLNNGKIPPAWNDQQMVLVDGRERRPECFEVSSVEAYLEKGQKTDRPQPKWHVDALKGSDTVSLAIAPNAVVAVSETARPRDLRTNWKVSVVAVEGGQLLSQQQLSSAALPGGLAIDRDGRVIVVLENGEVVCLGGEKALSARLSALVKLAGDGPPARERAVDALQRILESAQGAEACRLVADALEQLGIHAGDRARRAGCIADWHLIGPFTWDSADHNVDEVLVGEPQIDLNRKFAGKDRTLHWRPVVTDDPDGKVDLLRIMGAADLVSAYAYAEFELPDARPLQLKVGSNDGFKCWANGAVVGRFDGGRTYAHDQDSLPMQGKKGRNRILIKITQMGGAWAFGVRICDADGNPLDLVALTGDRRS
ncbi:MAG: PQQ-binding-like beta-propeller repeat protein, partial [Pirellulales bacterium]